jgi:hypothetical protein
MTSGGWSAKSCIRSGGYGWRRGRGSGLGFYLPFLPWYCDTYWWGGIPYYYADSNYYVWDGDVGEYEAVEPPAGLSHKADNRQADRSLLPSRFMKT